MKTTVLSAIFLTLCGVGSAQPLPRRADPRPGPVIHESAPDRLVVQHRIGADPDSIQRSFSLHGAALHAHHASLRISVLRVDPARRDQIQKALEASGLFDFVEPDYLAHVNTTPNDPGYPSQWHLATIQAPYAWNITTGSTSVPIAMVDSGVDTTHPDLASKVVGGWNFLTGNSTITDTMGHGTTTAGAAAAIGNNGVGVAGVAWLNPIMPLIVVDATGYASYSNMASAISYAADHGARIVNVSIGGTSPSSTLQTAVNYAWNKGTIVFASAGNGGINAPYYPAGCQNVVSVGATDSTDTVAAFSNYGSFLSLTAPGVNIYTTTSGGGYGYGTGTSYSSPIAAAVGALMLSKSPSLSASTLVSTLEQNSDDLGPAGWDQYYGWGRVNAYKALNATTTTTNNPPVVSISSPSNGNTVKASLAVQGTATDTVSLSQIQFFVDGNLASTAYASPFSFAWNTSTSSNGTHTLSVKAYDVANNMGQASVSVSVNNVVTIDTTPPTVYISNPANGSTVHNGNLQITAVASDNVAVTQVSVYMDGVLQYTGSVAPYSFGLNSKKLASGSHTIFAKAWDAAGNVGTSSTITVTK
ncbi:MAG TPA: S8 family serine peptidase [Bryobacteraceae bacterium]|nr:S8 family serine peptidase [Bryobacteraceae bacterium]